MESKSIKLMRKTQLTNDQISLIIGSLLGDGYLDKTTIGYSLRLHHGLKQKDYIFWKYRLLSNIVNSKPKSYTNKAYYFRTISHPYLTSLRSKFYRGKTKIIPRNFLESIISPLALAVWIMDDGTNELGRSKCLRINTQGFTKEDQEFLCFILKKKFGLSATLNQDKRKYRIRIAKASMEKLTRIVKSYILPSLFYKLSP